MLKKVFYIMAGLSLAFLSSCTHIYYDTNTSGGGIDRQADNSTVYDTVKLSFGAYDTTTWSKGLSAESDSLDITANGEYTFIASSSKVGGWSNESLVNSGCFVFEETGLSYSCTLSSTGVDNAQWDSIKDNVSINCTIYTATSTDSSTWTEIASSSSALSSVYDSSNSYAGYTGVNIDFYSSIKSLSNVAKIKVIATFSGID